MTDLFTYVPKDGCVLQCEYLEGTCASIIPVSADTSQNYFTTELTSAWIIQAKKSIINGWP